jgi:hypothetical protein
MVTGRLLVDYLVLEIAVVFGLLSQSSYFRAWQLIADMEVMGPYFCIFSERAA